jgi:hypothetical protein
MASGFRSCHLGVCDVFRPVGLGFRAGLARRSGLGLACGGQGLGLLVSFAFIAVLGPRDHSAQRMAEVSV